jgi:transcriptional regulator with XRE-family HTH domain
MSLESRRLWAETITIAAVEEFGKVISRRRRTLGLSQKNLGEKTGVAPSAISRLELESNDSTPFGTVVRLVDALELELELRPRGSKFTPMPPTKLNELGLSPGTMSALGKEGLVEVAQLESATSMLERSELSNGVNLYEIVCALNRHGLSLPIRRAHRVPGDREREMLRLRIVEGMMLSEIARRYNLKDERIRQILTGFGLSGTPPTAARRRKMRAQSRR